MAITWQWKRTVVEPSLRGNPYESHSQDQQLSLCAIHNPFETHSQDQQLSLCAIHNGWVATIVFDEGYLVTIRNVLGVTRKRCRYATETEAMMVAENMLRDFGGE